jgi:hypothetical protein
MWSQSFIAREGVSRWSTSRPWIALLSNNFTSLREGWCTIKLDIDYDKLTPKELKAMLDSMYKDDNKPIKNVTPEPEIIESEEEKVLEKNSSES